MMKKFFAASIMLLAITSPSLANINVEVATPIQQAVGVILGTIVFFVFLVLAVGSYVVKKNNNRGKMDD